MTDPNCPDCKPRAPGQPMSHEDYRRALDLLGQREGLTDAEREKAAAMVASHMPKADDGRVSLLLPAGIVVKINGIPLELVDSALVKVRPENVPLLATRQRDCGLKLGTD